MTNESTIRIDRITQRDAAHVLFVMGMEGGIQPGGFTEKLIEAMVVADTSNLERLSYGFEGLVAAIHVYRRMDGGTGILRDIASGVPYMPVKS